MLSRVRFSAATRQVMLPPGIELDLGSTAKALASDLAAAEALDAMGEGGVLVNLGGDIAVAGAAPAEGWHMQLADDARAPVSVDRETISIRSGGVATRPLAAAGYVRTRPQLDGGAQRSLRRGRQLERGRARDREGAP